MKRPVVTFCSLGRFSGTYFSQNKRVYCFEYSTLVPTFHSELRDAATDKDRVPTVQERNFVEVFYCCFSLQSRHTLIFNNASSGLSVFYFVEYWTNFEEDVSDM